MKNYFNRLRNPATLIGITGYILTTKTSHTLNGLRTLKIQYFS